MGTAYTSAVAAIPSPLTKEFLPWVSSLVSYRQSESPVARSTTHYVAYDAAGDGTGGSGAGTEADPYLCTTVEHIDTLYSSLASGGDVSVLLKRGDEWQSSTGGIAQDIASTTIGAYGTGAKPILWGPGREYSSGWTLAAGNRYTRSEANDIAWVALASDLLGTILSRQTSQANCESTSNSFYNDTTGNVLHVNLGGTDPNTLTLRAFDINSLIGVELSANATRVDNILTYGWGCDPGSAGTQKHGIKTTVTGTDAAVASNCESYYNSSHCVGHNSSSSGGIVTFIDCSAGFTTDSSGGTTVFNGFSATGGGEVIFDNPTVVGGELPAGTSAYLPSATAVFGHTGSSTMALMLSRGLSHGDIDYPCAGATNFGDVPAASTITDARAFVINERATVHGTSNASPSSAFKIAGLNTVEIGGNNTVKPGASVTVRAATVNIQSGWALNCITTVDLSAVTETVYALWNIISGANTARLYNNRIKVIGNSATNFRIDHDAVTKSDGVELKNTILTAESFSSGKTAILNLGNNLVNAGNIANNAYFGWTGGSDTSTDDGYGNDAGKVEMAASPSLLASPTSDLIGAGEDVSLEYDYYGRTRSTVDIGPIANASSSTLRRNKYGIGLGLPLGL